VEDAELRNILFSIQGSIAGFQNDMSDVKNDIADMKTDIANMKTDITNMKSDIVQLKGSVKTIELKLENEIDRKISALFDARMDELRYRKENKETREKVFELDMRVDNLEKAIMPA
jgi:archaellum component FlaC